MATIFRKTRLRYLYQGRRITAAEAKQLEAQGERVLRRRERDKKWRIRYRLPDGRVREVPGYTDKAATKAKAIALERQAAREAAGLVSPADRHLTESIEEHLEAYIADIRAKGRAAKYGATTHSRIRAILRAARMTRLADLTAAKVQAVLADLLSAGLSVETRNQYLVAIKGFARWLWKGGILPENPLAGLSRLNADTARRRVRRALTAEELGRVVAAAERSAEVFYRLPGPDRAAIYLLAAGSGLRARELASLTASSLVLDSHPPVVRVEAAYAKNRRQDVVPLPDQVAEYLRQWTAARHFAPGQQLWPGSWYARAADMLRRDLVAAGIPYRDASGRVADFHCLRASYATLLARRGCNLQTAQALLRHSDPKLTARTYTKLGITDLGAAVAGLTVAAPCSPPYTGDTGRQGSLGPLMGPPAAAPTWHQLALSGTISRRPVKC